MAFPKPLVPVGSQLDKAGTGAGGRGAKTGANSKRQVAAAGNIAVPTRVPTSMLANGSGFAPRSAPVPAGALVQRQPSAVASSNPARQLPWTPRPGTGPPEPPARGVTPVSIPTFRPAATAPRPASGVVPKPAPAVIRAVIPAPAIARAARPVPVPMPPTPRAVPPVRSVAPPATAPITPRPTSYTATQVNVQPRKRVLNARSEREFEPQYVSSGATPVMLTPRPAYTSPLHVEPSATASKRRNVAPSLSVEPVSSGKAAAGQPNTIMSYFGKGSKTPATPRWDASNDIDEF